MKHSDSISELSKAVTQVQAQLQPAVINSANDFIGSRYADLGSVINACRSLMVDNGLSVVQLPTYPPPDYPPAVGLSTMLMHESGEWIQDEFYLPLAKEKGKNLAQVAGSIITYGRRYALAAMLGIVADEDTDGNGSAPTKAKAKSNGNQKPTGNGQKQPSAPMPTGAMVRKFHALGSSLYAKEWDDKRHVLVAAISTDRQDESGPVSSSKDLYRAEVQALIDGMEEKQRQRNGQPDSLAEVTKLLGLGPDNMG